MILGSYFQAFTRPEFQDKIIPVLTELEDRALWALIRNRGELQKLFRAKEWEFPRPIYLSDTDYAKHSYSEKEKTMLTFHKAGPDEAKQLEAKASALRLGEWRVRLGATEGRG